MSGTALATRDASATLEVANRGFVQLTSLREAREFAELLAMSDMVPKDYKGKEKVGNIIVAMQMGLELGIPPLQALQNIAVVNGRPAVYGDLIPALVRSASDFVDMVEEATDTSATCTITRKGQSPVTVTFTEADAKRAGLWGKQGPWTQYPKRMLLMRARSFAARDVYADRLKGLAIAEDLQDVDQAPTPSEPQRIKDVTPPKETASETTAPAGETKPAAVDTPPRASETKPAGTGNGQPTQQARGIAFKDTTKYVAPAGNKAAFWTVKVDAGEFFITDEQLAKTVDTCVDTDHTFTLTYKLTKRSNGDVVKHLVQLDPEDGQ